MDFYLILSKVSVIFLLILVGFFLAKKGFLTEQSQKEMTSLILYVLLPCTLIKSFDIDFSRDILNTGLKIAVTMFITYNVSYILADFIGKRYKLNLSQKDVHILSMVIPNVGFMGYPIVNAIMGPEGIIFAVMANMGFELFAWTIGIKTISRHSHIKNTDNIVVHLLKTPAIVAIIIGMILFTTPLSVPEPLKSTMLLLASAMSPIAMIIVGISLANSHITKLLKNKHMYITCITRLVVIPLLLLTALKTLKFYETLYYLPMILISMPTAGYATMFATKYESDSVLASELISMSTLFSLITIPVILSLL